MDSSRRCEKRGRSDDGREGGRGRPVAHTAGLLAVYLAIALASRVPALALGGVYGLHAVLLAAPLAFVTAAYASTCRRFAPAGAAMTLLGLLLGAMNPTMAAGLMGPAAIGGLTWMALRNSPARSVFAATCAGAAGYPAILIASAVSGSHVASAVEGIVCSAALAILGCGLSLLGSFAADELRRLLGSNRR